MHALIGCDSTSRVFGLDKANSFTKLISDELFGKYANVFTCSSSCKDEVIVAGEKLLLLLSGGKKEKTLDELRT